MNEVEELIEILNKNMLDSLMFDPLKNNLRVSKYKTLHDFYFNDCGPYEYRWRRKWRIYFEALLEIKDLPDNIRESIDNILIMDSLCTKSSS
jgi:hypothetical protein